MSDKMYDPKKLKAMLGDREMKGLEGDFYDYTPTEITPQRHMGAFINRENVLGELRRMSAERVAKFCHVPASAVLVRIIPGPTEVDITAVLDESQLGPKHKAPSAGELGAVLKQCGVAAHIRLRALNQTWAGHGR